MADDHRSLRDVRIIDAARQSSIVDAVRHPTPDHPDAPARLLVPRWISKYSKSARFCHVLKDREPASVVGGSILLFKLPDREVAFALNAPLSAFRERN